MRSSARVVPVSARAQLVAGTAIVKRRSPPVGPDNEGNLDHQSQVEATIAEIIAAGGTTIAVRADLADDLDVQRLFIESSAEFGGVDVVVHTTSDSAALLCQQAARHVRQRGAVVITSTPELIGPRVASQLRERGITVERVSPQAVLP